MVYRYSLLLLAINLVIGESHSGEGIHQFAGQRASKYELATVKQFIGDYFPDPTLSTKQAGKRHKETTSFHLHMHSSENSTEWLIDLRLNLDLIGANFRFFNGYVQDSNYEHCYYHGSIRGLTHSSVSLSTCNGLKGFVFDGTDLYHLEHFEATGEHFLYRSEDSLGSKGTCGVEGGSHEIHEKDFGQEFLRRSRRDQANKFIELFLAMDNAHYQLTGSNNSYSRQYAIEIANHMDFIYRSIGVRVALVGAEVWSTNDFITTNPDLSVLLQNWINYLPTLKSRKGASGITFDNAQLITGLSNSQSNVIGRAPLNSMCLSRSGGVNRDTRGTLATNIAATISHEMGHNLGMNHDDGRTCNDCSDQNRRCVMSAVINNPPPFLFTSCSTSDLSTALDSGVGSCIYNVPPRLFTDPFCGNAFVEEGEECDCGSIADCPSIDPCCEPGQCKLNAWAQCASGDCCDNCTYRGQEFTCRPKSGDCDIAERCTGDTSVCPNNLYRRNGVVCTSGSVNSFCYEGACRTLLDQCRYVWGPSANVARDICFDEVNVLGNQFGHCGVGQQAGVFVPCASANVKCGKLHCDVPQGARPILTGTYQITFYQFSGSLCTAISFNVEDMPDPGIVPDGTACDTSSVCLMGICTNVSELPFTTCPRGSNGLECSGEAECSNSGICVGNFTIPGGEAGGNAGVVAAVIIIIVILLLIIAFVIGGILIGYLLYKKHDDSKYKFDKSEKPKTSSGPPDRTSSFLDNPVRKGSSLPRYGNLAEPKVGYENLAEVKTPVNTSRPTVPRNKPSVENMRRPPPTRPPPKLQHKPTPPLAAKPKL